MSGSGPLGGHTGGASSRHTGGDRHTGGMTTPGWFWAPGGLAAHRAGPVLQGAALPGAVGDMPHHLDFQPGQAFPDGAWDPLLRAAVFAIAISRELDWPGMRTKLKTRLEAAEKPDAMRMELARLWYMQAFERAGRADEIIAQAGDFTTYYADLLGASPASRPHTWTLVLLGLQLAGLVTSQFKHEFKRARPAQVWPALQPMIDTPPHPSFPSGHGMQALLIARLVGLVAPTMLGRCENLAERVLRNREVAGVHWPSDGDASKDVVNSIASTIAAILARPADAQDEILIVQFRELLAAARGEWPAQAAHASPPPGPVDSGGQAVSGYPFPDNHAAQQAAEAIQAILTLLGTQFPGAPDPNDMKAALTTALTRIARLFAP